MHDRRLTINHFVILLRVVKEQTKVLQQTHDHEMRVNHVGVEIRHGIISQPCRDNHHQFSLELGTELEGPWQLGGLCFDVDREVDAGYHL